MFVFRVDFLDEVSLAAVESYAHEHAVQRVESRHGPHQPRLSRVLAAEELTLQHQRARDGGRHKSRQSERIQEVRLLHGHEEVGRVHLDLLRLGLTLAVEALARQGHCVRADVLLGDAAAEPARYQHWQEQGLLEYHARDQVEHLVKI